MEDPETRKLKGFGFTDLESLEATIRALRLLNGLEIGGKQLIVKIDEGEFFFFNIQGIEGKINTKTQILNFIAIDSIDDIQIRKELAKIINDNSLFKSPHVKHINTNHLERKIYLSPNTMKKSKDKNKTESSYSYKNNLEIFSNSKIDQDYNLECQEWERYENERRRWKQNNNTRNIELKKEREKNIKKDYEHSSSDEHLDLWGRKMLRYSERSHLRRRIRCQEENDDDLNRSNEEKEITSRTKVMISCTEPTQARKNSIEDKNNSNSFLTKKIWNYK
eukprot:gnl/TRDRNA2_/TRDRNA2_177954_c2_seq1.p1 gnl/TRDRNA2_/TRDRNA2_177954_c2~~gnl/TRDRNA2_/TRDRNA2_177954_c2_seq1.p1  ORF type:complete len:299 (-),score=0.91 gnl/TRDRNA2_/TRDRNA2_177954_c2_seq1:859-1692(-)